MAISLSELEKEIERINKLPLAERRKAQKELRNRRKELSLEAQVFMAQYTAFYVATMRPIVADVLKDFDIGKELSEELGELSDLAKSQKKATSTAIREIEGKHARATKFSKPEFKRKLNKAMDDAKFLEKNKKFISNKVSESFSVGTGDTNLVLNKSQVENLTKSRWAPGNKSAIRRLDGASVQIQEQVVNEISDAVEKGTLIRDNSKKLLGDISNPKVPIGNVTGDNLNKKLKKITDDFKRLGKVDAKLQREINSFRKTVTKMDVRGLQKTGTVTNRLKNAYSGVLDSVESGVQDAVDAAVKKAIQEKGKYLTDRIARTEIARARYEGFVWRAQQDPDIVAIRFVLSDAHPAKDQCDFYTKVNFGLGPGVWPLNKLPEFPFHSHCLCYQVEVFTEEVQDMSFEDSEKAGRKLLDTFSKRDRQRLFNIAGEEQYQKGASWKKLGKSKGWWDNPVRPDLSIKD